VALRGSLSLRTSVRKGALHETASRRVVVPIDKRVPGVLFLLANMTGSRRTPQSG
jgi:hypothetical protein